jgi:Tfp pilus assembly protein PilF
MKNTASFSRISAAVGLILGAAATAVFAQTDYSLIQKYRVLEPTVAKAQKYLDQGQVDRCTAEINRCFETVPDHHGAQYIRAQVLYKRTDYAAALEAMGQARGG